MISSSVPIVPVNPPQSRYIPEIDGLRAVAVLAVVLYHLRGTLLPGGFVGVDVFFVISGYVVSSSLTRDRGLSFIPFVAHFYGRRIRRILPALVICLIVTSLVHVLFVPPSWLSDTAARTARFAFFGLSNIVLAENSDRYFAPKVEFNPFTHTWSLGVEEQFYLVFPAVFFLWLLGQRSRNRTWHADWLLGSLMFFSFATAIWETSAHPERAFYLLPSRYWELAVGVFLSTRHAQDRWVLRGSDHASRAAWVGALLLAIGFLMADPQRFPFPWSLLPVVGTALLLVVVTSPVACHVSIRRVLRAEPTVWIGRRSYSLYLWHWPILVLFRWTVGLEQSTWLLLAVGLMTIATILSYRYIEQPFREGAIVRRAPDVWVITAGVAALLLAAIADRSIFLSQGRLSLSVTRNRAVWYPYGQLEPPPIDTVTIASAGRQLFVLGDSHAGAYEAMLNAFGRRHEVVVLKIANNGCPVASLLRPVSAACRVAQDAALAEITTRARPGDIVLLASLRVARLSDQWGPLAALRAADSSVSDRRTARLLYDQAMAEADTIVTTLSNRGLVIMLDAPKPVFRAPPYRCADWFNSANPSCREGFLMPRGSLFEHRKPAMLALNTLQRRYAAVRVWDPFPSLCPAATCDAFDGSSPLFFDGDHLSGYGNQVLYPSFVRYVADIWSTTRKTESNVSDGPGSLP
jgi:peptidoglycan/LPS O-acetylase OafA/YrhL